MNNDITKICERLLDSEEHATEAAIPQVAEDAVEIIQGLADDALRCASASSARSFKEHTVARRSMVMGLPPTARCSPAGAMSDPSRLKLPGVTSGMPISIWRPCWTKSTCKER